ncbi:hypothetical protein SAY87_006113 [Trapa incisa]|uniref:Uncharacterized protein n=1 Tax=Trapa incisa TaxID=236973 RepID=A0AAN7K5W4_9MYRT|nr:hypothetical protein SAY87_006113 [Trapa incisa]
MKLEAVEVKLHDLRSNTATLGKEAAASMAVVETQQQRFTLQMLITLMISEWQRMEAPSDASFSNSMTSCPPYEETNDVYVSHLSNESTVKICYILGEAIQDFLGGQIGK